MTKMTDDTIGIDISKATLGNYLNRHIAFGNPPQNTTAGPAPSVL